MPTEVRREFGYALYRAQVGRKHVKAKALKGFGSAGILEVVTSGKGSTFRAVYTVKFADRYTSCIACRRNLSRASPPRSRIWTSFGSG